jgi:hypothetical protein
MSKGIKRKRFAAISVLLLAATTMSAHAATITVTNRNDSGPGSLRQALANANNGDRINFAVTGAITLTSGGLSIAKNVTISGPGANHLSINGNQASSVFAIAFERTATISGLTITNGGVGIWNQQGTVSVSNCVLSGNSFAALYNNYAAQGSGGASMTVANSIVSNNSGTGAVNMFPVFLGGGPSGFPCSCMTITDSVVSNNSDGIFNLGFDFSGTANLTVVNSNVSDNDGLGIGNSSAGFIGGNASLTVVNSNVSDNGGSGISNDANESSVYATIVSTTVSGNSAGGVLTCGCGAFGGFAGVTITNSTISGNSSGDSGGGIHLRGITYLSIANSTISGNSAGTSGGRHLCQWFCCQLSGPHQHCE